MYYNSNSNNPYAKRFLPQNIPDGKVLRVGKPIETPFGLGIIVNMVYGNGGLYPKDYVRPPLIAIDVLFANEPKPFRIPLETLNYSTGGGFGGALPNNWQLN